MKNLKTHLFSYNYEGSKYSLEIPASDAREAKERLSKLAFAKYDGELVAKIPALPANGFIPRLLTSLLNRINK